MGFLSSEGHEAFDYEDHEHKAKKCHCRKSRCKSRLMTLCLVSLVLLCLALGILHLLSLFRGAFVLFLVTEVHRNKLFTHFRRAVLERWLHKTGCQSASFDRRAREAVRRLLRVRLRQLGAVAPDPRRPGHRVQLRAAHHRPGVRAETWATTLSYFLLHLTLEMSVDQLSSKRTRFPPNIVANFMINKKILIDGFRGQ